MRFLVGPKRWRRINAFALLRAFGALVEAVSAATAAGCTRLQVARRIGGLSATASAVTTSSMRRWVPWLWGAQGAQRGGLSRALSAQPDLA